MFLRYFVIKVMEGGKTAYLGLGFSDRADSFDVNTTLHDHFKGIKVKAYAGDCYCLEPLWSSSIQSAELAWSATDSLHP